MQDFAQFANLGVAGLAVWLFYKIASNHIDHNTQAIKELKEVLTEIKIYFQHGK